MKILKVNRNRVEGCLDTKSTVDYTGTAYGIPICFDAKETRGLNLPGKNIGEHQMQHMLHWETAGGIAFLVVWFRDPDRIFRIRVQDVANYFKDPWIHNPKSIPLLYFEQHAKEIEKSVSIPVHYLEDITTETRRI